MMYNPLEFDTHDGCFLHREIRSPKFRSSQRSQHLHLIHCRNVICLHCDVQPLPWWVPKQNLFEKHDKLNIKEVPWRCPQVGKGTQGFLGTDHLPPLPPMNEVMADSLKWDPLGHRWGRGAHWPLILGVGHRRERTPAQKQKRAAHRREKKGYSRTSALAEDPYPSSSAASWRPSRGQADTYWEQHQGWYSGASGSGSWQTEARWEQRTNR